MSRTNPYRADTDRDGLPDGREDPDHDGLTNRQEYLAGMNPRRADTDGDGFRDGREDTDHDGLKTAFEFLAGTSPRHADSDHDGLRDGREDPDRDGLSNTTEQQLGTLPRTRDTDGDGWTDGAEYKAGTNPRNASSHPAPPTPPPPDPAPAGHAADPARRRPDAPGCSRLPGLPGHERLEHADRRSCRGGRLGDDDRRRSAWTAACTWTSGRTPATASRTTSSAPRPRARRSTFDYDDDSDHVGYPIPASPLIEGGSDRHILLVDKDACRLYELFAARQVGGAWQAGSGATWDLRSNALRPDGWTSADAAGLPILPGLVRYDEVAAGAIAHALRFTTNQTRERATSTRPATRPGESTSHVAAADGPPRPPQGVLRHESASRPQARVIAEALKRYGMILADNGSPWYITGRERSALRRRRACTSSTSSPGATSRSSTRPGWSTVRSPP